jgi:hypothetical protein
LGNPANAFEHPEMDPIKSLKILEAKTQNGASYDDYSFVYYLKELANTKSEVKFFMESSDAKNKFKLTEAMKKAIEHFDFAKLVWERAKKRKEMESELFQMNLSIKSGPFKKRKARKENLKKLQEEERLRSMGKSIYYLDKIKDFDILQRISTKYLNNSIITKQETHIDELLPIIWRQASIEVKNATTAFHKQTQNVKETDLDNKIEENSRVTEDSPVILTKQTKRTKRKAIKPPPAPPALEKETPEPLPVDGSVMRMINPNIRDLD